MPRTHPSSAPPIDWPAFVRRVERKRRALDGAPAGRQPPPDDYYARATWATFRLDGHDVSEADVRAALGQGDGRTALLRSRLDQRLRNHAAIVHHVESRLREQAPLTADAVIRWYTTISAGLSTTALDRAAHARLEDVVRRVNSPQLRIQAALAEIAAMHARLLKEPLVPSFNGILARLLLRYHLGRCKLPPVVFDPACDGRLGGADAVLRRLVELIERGYDELLEGRA